MCQSEFSPVLQSTVTLDNNALVHVLDWDGQEATLRRRLVNGKMVVVVSSVSLFSLTPITPTRKSPK